MQSSFPGGQFHTGRYRKFTLCRSLKLQTALENSIPIQEAFHTKLSLDRGKAKHINWLFSDNINTTTHVIVTSYNIQNINLKDFRLIINEIINLNLSHRQLTLKEHCNNYSLRLFKLSKSHLTKNTKQICNVATITPFTVSTLYITSFGCNAWDRKELLLESEFNPWIQNYKQVTQYPWG